MTIDPESLARERFAEHAGEYVRSESHARADDLDALVRLADARPEWVALDAALT